MFNLMVDNLDEALAQVKDGGAQVVGEIERYDYGTFGWFVDPDGNKVELWEPKPHASTGQGAAGLAPRIGTLSNRFVITINNDFCVFCAFSG